MVDDEEGNALIELLFQLLSGESISEDAIKRYDATLVKPAYGSPHGIEVTLNGERVLLSYRKRKLKEKEPKVVRRCDHCGCKLGDLEHHDRDCPTTPF